MLNPINAKSIAIVGVSCRFPQAKNIDEFWALLINGIDAVEEIPQKRWDVQRFYDQNPAAPEKSVQKDSALLDDVHHFDPYFFNISPLEAKEMTPSQKLMLELAWETFLDSRIPFMKMRGSKTGVFVGNSWADFEKVRFAKKAPMNQHTALGQCANIIANRVSYHFGLTGPSLVVDTGCSSSMVAIQIACQNIWEGNCSLALAGGVNHLLDPDLYAILSKFGGLSPTGKCHAFDQEADGFVRGEGGGFILLKSLEDAIRDKDNIHAVIRGISINNNGNNANLPAPSISGQVEVIKEAYRFAGFTPADIQYLEAHGTGTRLGDKTETQAIGQAVGKSRDTKNPLLIGSVKTNIGHLEAAAGMAGLIKVLVSMKNRAIPKSLHFNTPNPDIPFDELNIKVQSEPSPWPVREGETMKAGVNSFGWGGTNAHLVLEEFVPCSEVPENGSLAGRSQIFVASAKTEHALTELVSSYQNILKDAKPAAYYVDLCAASALKNPNMEYRAAFAVASNEDLKTKLKDYLAVHQSAKPCDATGRKKTAFVFSGHGSQWLGMGTGLYHKYDVFKKAIDECESAFAPYLSWSITQELFADEASSNLQNISYGQPLICAIQIAMARLWISWGIEPDTIVGHSMGEVAAAYIAENISLDDAARIICTRSRLMLKVSGKGAMAVTELNVNDARQLVEGYTGRLELAVSNSPKSTVLAGEPEAIDEVVEKLDKQGLFSRKVKVDVASHCYQMDGIAKELGSELGTILPLANNRYRFASTVLEDFVDGAQLDTSYWVKNLRNPVRFAQIIEKLLKENIDTFIEISGHPVLTTAIGECADALNIEATVVHSTHKKEEEENELLVRLGELYVSGILPDWTKVFPAGVPAVALPPYPYQREAYELEDRSDLYMANQKIGSKENALLGDKIALADEDGKYYWLTSISINDLPYLKHSETTLESVFPNVGFMVMALEAMNSIYKSSNVGFKEFNFYSKTILTEKPVEIQTLAHVLKDNKTKVKFFAKLGGNWVLKAEALVEAIPHEQKVRRGGAHRFQPSFKGFRKISKETYYQMLGKVGLSYNDNFQCISEIWLNYKSYVVAKVKLPDHILSEKMKSNVHLELLDSLLHPMFNNVIKQDGMPERSSYLSSFRDLKLNSDICTRDEFWVSMRMGSDELEQKGEVHTVSATVTVYDQYGRRLMQGEKVESKIHNKIMLPAEHEAAKEKLFYTDWIPKTVNPKNHKIKEQIEKERKWLIFSDEHIGPMLLEKIVEFGGNCTLIQAGEQFQKGIYTLGMLDLEYIEIDAACKDDYLKVMRIADPAKEVRGIIHLFCTEHQYGPLSADSLMENQSNGVLSLVYLSNAIKQFYLSKPPRLVVATSNAQHLEHSPGDINLCHAPAWAISKVIAEEYSELDCRRFDLSAQSKQVEIKTFFEAIFTPDGDNEQIIRHDSIWVPRLKRYEKLLSGLSTQLSSEASYLVTGFGGIAMYFIDWMFARGARHFILASRSGKVSEKARPQYENLLAKGAQFDIVTCDIADGAAVKLLLEGIKEKHPPLKGIVHAAGIIETHLLSDFTKEEYFRIATPKLKGAWNLHHLTADLKLDLFVLFSSASTLFGISGLGSYMASNSFLDALAHYRRRMGLNATSINWGTIKDVGMVATDDHLERFASAEGFETLKMSDAIQALDCVFPENLSQIGILDINVERIREFYPVLASSGFLNELNRSESPSLLGHEVGGSFLDELEKMPSRAERAKSIEALVRTMVSQATNAPVERIGVGITFKGIGVDSLMAVQLRNKLNKIFESKLPVTAFWNYPTVKEYAAFLIDHLGLDPEQKPEEASLVPDAIDLDSKSLDELGDLLDSMLG